jgi:hypothetical protein
MQTLLSNHPPTPQIPAIGSRDIHVCNVSSPGRNTAGTFSARLPVACTGTVYCTTSVVLLIWPCHPRETVTLLFSMTTNRGSVDVPNQIPYAVNATGTSDESWLRCAYELRKTLEKTEFFFVDIEGLTLRHSVRLQFGTASYPVHCGPKSH